jgi:hypothetical protein
LESLLAESTCDPADASALEGRGDRQAEAETEAAPGRGGYRLQDDPLMAAREAAEEIEGEN